MSRPSTESNPFEESRTSRWVWIVPSVLVHVAALVVWLMLPEKPREAPARRKLTINREQAQMLQKHVEDANLIELRAQVSELQEIKQAMANIRKDRMQAVRQYEAVRTESAPSESREILEQFLDAQEPLIPVYRDLLERVRAVEEISDVARTTLKAEGVNAAAPQLQEIEELRKQILLKLNQPDSALAEGLALADTAEVRLEWISDPAYVQLAADWLKTLDHARSSHLESVSSLRTAYGGKAEWAIKEVISRAEDYDLHLNQVAKLQAGEKPVPDWQQKKVQIMKTRLDFIFPPPADPDLIENALQAQEKLYQITRELLETLPAKPESAEDAV